MTLGHIPWHQVDGALARFVADLIVDEVAQLRPGAAALAAGPWPLATPLGQDGQGSGLGLDSLERMSVGAALNEALHLHESGIEDLLLVRTTFGDWVNIAQRALRQFDAQLTFRTSGSSGRPKACTHTLADLLQETRFLATLFAGSNSAGAVLRRIRTAVPAHHIYGFLFTVLLPIELGAEESLPVDDVRAVTVNSLPRRLAAGDLLVSHPTHWALLARHASALPAGVVGSTSTAPCPDSTAQALTERGLQRLVQVYGSSETAGIAWRDAPAAAYALMPHWSRPAAAADDADAAGTAAAAELLRHAEGHAPRAFALQDRLQWQDDRHFQIAGRLDHAVQVGGINVFPARVRDLLLQHPDVADAAVRLMAAHEGDRLKAYLVPKPDADATTLAARLDAWVATRLAAAERPRAYTLGAALPRSPQGKLADWGA